MSQTKALLLAGGLGTRLKELTETWPKCLMPIQDRPLLDYWLNILQSTCVNDVYINLHHHRDIVLSYLAHKNKTIKIEMLIEDQLLGTAGTLQANASNFLNCTTLLVHADNWCQTNFSDFLKYHRYGRPKECLITMMIFDSDNSKDCGIVEINNEGVVMQFHEKKENAPGRLANAAIFLLEPEVINWIKDQDKLVDFSAEVIPKFLGKIATWKNNFIHRDIGSIKQLRLAQDDNCIWQSFKADKWDRYTDMMKISDQILTREIT